MDTRSFDSRFGILLRQSALRFDFPALHSTVKSYSSNFNLHWKSLELGSLSRKSQIRGLWSVIILNFLPYKYVLKCFTAQKIARSSRSMVE